MAIAGRPAVGAVERAVGEPPTTTTAASVAVSIASSRRDGRRGHAAPLTGRRGAAQARGRRYRAMPASTSERDPSRLVAGPLDADVEPARRQRVAEPLRPLDERDALDLALVDQAAGERVGRVGEPVQVEVEQRQAAARTRP